MDSSILVTRTEHSTAFRAANGAAAALCLAGLVVMFVNYGGFAFGYAGTHFVLASGALHTLALFNYAAWDALRIATTGFGIGVVMLQTTFLQVGFGSYYLEWVGAHPPTNTALQEVLVIVLAPTLSAMHVAGTKPVRVALLLLLAFAATSLVFLIHEVLFAASPGHFERSLTTTTSVVALYLSGLAMTFGTSLGIEAVVRCAEQAS